MTILSEVFPPHFSPCCCIFAEWEFFFSICEVSFAHAFCFRGESHTKMTLFLAKNA